MKTCPKCNEIVGDSVNKCFNCNYSFELKRVVTKDEINEMARLVEEKKQREKIEFETNRTKNALYEYEVVVLQDKSTGGFNVDEYIRILSKYSAEGWQLKFVFSNEIGKNSSTIGLGGVSYGTNATIDNTIITFERCIRPSSL